MDQDSKEATMNRIRHIGRLAGALAGLALTWLGLAAAAPAAFAENYPLPANGGAGGSTGTTPLPYGHWTGPVQIPVHTVIVGGMPGWQIALIAAGAALVAAIAALLLARARTGQRKPTPATA
jgi:hypothetical protein